MNVASRPVPTGRTRACPHCKAVILESLSVCPGCHHHLRFDSEAARRQVAATTALKLDGVIRHPARDEPWEYLIVISTRNDRGEELDRQVVNVGALQGVETRTFTLSVQVLPPRAPPEPPGVEPPAAASWAEGASGAQAPSGPRGPGGPPRNTPDTPPPAAGSLPKGPTAGAKAPGAAPPAAASGIRLPDGTVLAPPGLGPKRK